MAEAGERCLPKNLQINARSYDIVKSMQTVHGLPVKVDEYLSSLVEPVAKPKRKTHTLAPKMNATTHSDTVYYASFNAGKRRSAAKS